MVTHIVLFRLEDRSPENITRTAEILRSMEGRIDVLKGLEVGINQRDTPNSHDIALVTRFESWEDYDAYRVHPYHVDPVLKHMHAVAAGAAVADYEG
jgi:hypothetical protein